MIETFIKNFKLALIILTALSIVASCALAANRADNKTKNSKKRINEIKKAPAAPSFGKKLVEFETGTEENKLGLLKTPKGNIPFGLFYAPSSFFIDKKEMLYIIDSRNYRVSVFNINDNFSFFKSLNYFTDVKHVSHMSDIAVSADGAIFLGDDRNLSVIRFSSLGIPEAVFGTKENEFKGFKQINEIALDKKNTLYVRDYSQSKIFKFTSDAKFAGELKSNAGLCFFSDNFHPCFEYHADSKSWQIYAESEAGEIEKPITEIKRRTPDQNIQFIGIDCEDNLYIKTFFSNNIEIVKSSRDGKRIERYKGHNIPDFDATRLFFINPVKKTVYSARFNGKNIEIDELEKIN